MKIKINELFRLSRILEGVKQKDIAMSAGISQPAIQRFETGLTTLSVTTLRKIAPILHINPEFVTDQAKNPFNSKELIKMFFNERMSYYIVEPLNLLVTFNDELKFISLESSFDLSPKIGDLSLYPNPTYAVTIRDQNDNIFLLRRKKNTAFVKLDGQLDVEVCPIVQVYSDRKKLGSMYFSSKKISYDLYKKIKDWSVERKDVEPLFSQCHFQASLSVLDMTVVKNTYV